MTIFASTGKPGKLGSVHIDVITSISAPRRWTRTRTKLEGGAPTEAHRKRDPFEMSVDVLVSDLPPDATAQWELHHAQKTRDRVRALQQSGVASTFFDGSEQWIADGRAAVWVVDEIDEGADPTATGVWRATIKLGERPIASTQFTATAPGGIVDKGQQGVEPVDPSIEGIAL